MKQYEDELARKRQLSEHELNRQVCAFRDNLQWFEMLDMRYSSSRGQGAESYGTGMSVLTWDWGM